MLTPDTIQFTAVQMQVALSHEQCAQFATYAKHLLEWNQKINLTAITDDQGILTRHIADSLSLLAPNDSHRDTLKSLTIRTRTSNLIDIGTGAGFPGLALKIARPDLDVTLIDGTGKKIAFCQRIIDELKLSGVRALQARADDLAHEASHRENYDIVIARAVATLNTLAEYMLPFARVGGLCVAYKGADSSAEVSSARTAIKNLGGSTARICPVSVPGLPDQRSLILIQKAESTRARYPRTGGAPRSAPM